MKAILSTLLLCISLSVAVFAQHSIGRAPNVPGSTPGTLPPLGNGSTPFGTVLDIYLGYSVMEVQSSNFLLSTKFTFPSAYGFYAGDFADGKYYVADYYGTELYIANFTTNTFTSVAPITGIVSGQGITGMTYHAPSGKMYFSTTDMSTSSLYTLNLTTGVLTLIGQITNAPGIIDIAINTAGKLYGVDIINDNFIEINTASGAGTIIGSTGFNANYAQGMDFDDATGKLYWAAYGSGTSFREINIATGSSVEIATGTSEYDALAIGSGTPPVVPVSMFVVIALFGILGAVFAVRFFRK